MKNRRGHQPAKRDIVQFYQELAPSLAQMHDLPYPEDLARVMSRRLELLRDTI